MVTFEAKSRSESEKFLEQYIQQMGGGEYRPAPVEVCSALGGQAGLVLVTGDIEKSKGYSFLATGEEGNETKIMRRKSQESISRKASHHNSENLNKDDDDMSRMTADEDDMSQSDNDSGNDDPIENEQEIINNLTKRLAEYEAERDRSLQQNIDLQKKVAALMVRLGRDGGARTSDVVPEVDTTAADNTSEKEKHFLDTLQSIQEGRGKLQRQQAEYDQLAQDLQTRLDDKEFKASDIAESFKKFKQ